LPLANGALAASFPATKAFSSEVKSPSGSENAMNEIFRVRDPIKSDRAP